MNRSSSSRSLSLRTRILLIFASASLSTLLIITVSIYLLVNTSERDGWRDRQLEAAKTSSKQILGFLEQAQRSQTLLSLLETMLEESRLRALMTAIMLSGPNLSEIVITDAEGNVTINIARGESILTNPAESEWFTKTLEEAPAGTNYLGDLGFLSDGSTYFIVASKTRSGGVIAFQLNASLLNGVVQELAFGRTGNAYLVESGGLILAHTDPSVIEARTSLADIQTIPDIEKVEFINNNLATLNETVILNEAEYTNFQGVPVLGITNLISGAGWLLYIEVSQEEVFANSRNALFILSVFSLASWVFSMVGFSRLLSDLLFKPLDNLQKGEQAVEKGNLGHQVPILRQDEIGQVSMGFNLMSKQLYERNQQKDEQEKRLRAIYDVMTQSFDSVDEQLRQALKVGTQFLDMDLGIISQIEDDTYTVLYAYTSDNSLQSGQEFAFKQTYCDLTYQANDLVNIHYMKESAYYQHPAYANFGLESYIGIPLIVAGKRFGTLNFSSAKMRPTPFINEDKDFFILMGKWVSSVLERESSERIIKQRDAILEAVSFGSEKLLKTPYWKNTVQDVLAHLGNAAQASRIYIFENQPPTLEGVILVDQKYEWVADGISSEIDNPDLQNLSLDEALPRWKSVLNNGDTISGFIKDFPDSERKILEPQKIVSILVFPIFVNDEWWGFIGFDECTGERTWQPLEIEALRSAANNIGATIQREEAELVVQSQNETLIKANRELAIARRQAEAANKLKSQFLATMSHELRTPLNAVIGYSQLQLAGMAGAITDEQKNFQERILVNAHHLLNLINEVLDISKIEAGRMELTQRPISLQGIFDEVVAQNRVLAENKGLLFELKYDERLPQVLIGDRGRLKQIIINLISNAIKFTDKGKVTVEAVFHNKDAWRIVVTDTGMGIASHEQETIFDEFRQAENGIERGGTGLGLAIVRKLVAMMGGNIRVTSDIGMGSSFTVTLPIITEIPEETLEPSVKEQ